MADNIRHQILIKEVDNLRAIIQNTSKDVGDLKEDASTLQRNVADIKENLWQMKEMLVSMQGNSTASLCNPTNQGNDFLLIRMVKPDFPLFYGEEVKSWISHCERFFILEHTPGHSKVKLASSTLRGRALFWHQTYEYNILRNNLPLDWPNYVEAITNRFEKTPSAKSLLLLPTPPTEKYNLSSNTWIDDDFVEGESKYDPNVFTDKGYAALAIEKNNVLAHGFLIPPIVQMQAIAVQQASMMMPPNLVFQPTLTLNPQQYMFNRGLLLANPFDDTIGFEDFPLNYALAQVEESSNEVWSSNQLSEEVPKIFRDVLIVIWSWFYKDLKLRAKDQSMKIDDSQSSSETYANGKNYKQNKSKSDFLDQLESSASSSTLRFGSDMASFSLAFDFASGYHSGLTPFLLTSSSFFGVSLSTSPSSTSHLLSNRELDVVIKTTDGEIHGRDLENDEICKEENTQVRRQILQDSDFNSISNQEVLDKTMGELVVENVKQLKDDVLEDSEMVKDKDEHVHGQGRDSFPHDTTQYVVYESKPNSELTLEEAAIKIHDSFGDDTTKNCVIARETIKLGLLNVTSDGNFKENPLEHEGNSIRLNDSLEKNSSPTSNFGGPASSTHAIDLEKASYFQRRLLQENKTKRAREEKSISYAKDEDWMKEKHEKLEEHDSYILFIPLIADIENDCISKLLLEISPPVHAYLRPKSFHWCQNYYSNLHSFLALNDGFSKERPINILVAKIQEKKVDISDCQKDATTNSPRNIKYSSSRLDKTLENITFIIKNWHYKNIEVILPTFELGGDQSLLLIPFNKENDDLVFIVGIFMPGNISVQEELVEKTIVNERIRLLSSGEWSPENIMSTPQDASYISFQSLNELGGVQCQVVNRLFFTIISYIIWGWYYKDGEDFFAICNEDIGLIITQYPQYREYREHPGCWVKVWKTAWMFQELIPASTLLKHTFQLFILNFTKLIRM